MRSRSYDDVFGFDELVGGVVGVGALIGGEFSCAQVLLDEVGVFGTEDGVFVQEGGQSVVVFHAGVLEVVLVAEVQGADVGIHFLY